MPWAVAPADMKPPGLARALEYYLVSFREFKQEACREVGRFLACYCNVRRHALDVIGIFYASYGVIKPFAPISRSDDNGLLQRVSQRLQKVDAEKLQPGYFLICRRIVDFQPFGRLGTGKLF